MEYNGFGEKKVHCAHNCLWLKTLKLMQPLKKKKASISFSNAISNTWDHDNISPFLGMQNQTQLVSECVLL